MAEPGITLTPNLGLEKPDKGYRDWDVPVNGNWDKLDEADAKNVKIIGNQAIKGIKTFLNRVQAKQNDIDINSTPVTSEVSPILQVYDKNENNISYIQTIKNADGKFGLDIASVREINGVMKYASIKALVDSNGVPYVKVPTPLERSNTTDAATTAWVNSKLSTISEDVGTVKIWPTAIPPAGWLACNGAAISRTTYANLFAIIGIAFGAGDDSTTFNLPNVSDNRFIEFSTTNIGTQREAGLPNITGNMIGIYYNSSQFSSYTGAFKLTDTHVQGTSGVGEDRVANIDASRSSDIYGKSTTVQPKALVLNAVIKY